MKTFVDPRSLLRDTEKSWIETRKNELGKTNGQAVADSPFVYMDRRLATEMLAKIKLYELSSLIQGSVVECGVHRGNSTMLFSHLSSILEPVGFNRKIIGFDTFCGFSKPTSVDPENVQTGDMGDVDFDHLSKWVDLQEMNKLIPHIPKVELVKGDAIKTIPQYVNENPHLIVSLLYLDFDLYEPTKVALENFVPLMPKGSVIAFDQLNQLRWKGESIAVKEYFDLNKIKICKFPFEPHISYVVLD